MADSRASKAEMALARYKSTAVQRFQENRATVRTVVSSAEILAGAAAAGYADTKFGTMYGMQPSAAGGLIMLGIGIGMGQKDLTSVGLGMLAGQAYVQGAKAAV